MTAGFWFDGRRWAAVRGAGLVDLWTAAGIIRAERLPPAVRMARSALLAGGAPADLAAAAAITEGTAWTYFCRAAQHVPGDELRRRVPALVGERLWSALLRLRGDARLGGPLGELAGLVVSTDGTLSQLRLGRLAAIV